MATSTGTLKSLVRLGYVRSIADQYEEQAPHVSAKLQWLLRDLRSRCDAAMQCWPEKLGKKDFGRIASMLEDLGNNTPLGKKRDITTYTSFGLCLLEDMTPMLKAHKKAAVDQVKYSLLDVHNHFSDGKEYFQCLRAGAKGADVWNHTSI
jgi:hypothetical protein